MSKYKIIFSDIDGTLLNSKHEITEETKLAISNLSKKKVPVILVSARMPKGIVSLKNELNLDGPIICYNGALVVDNELNSMLSKQILIEYIEQICKYAKDENIHVSLYKDDEWYIEKNDEWSEQESKITSIIPNIIDYNILFDLLKKEHTGVHKVLCMSSPEKIEKFSEILKKNFESELNIYTSKPTYLEIMSKDASKIKAIDFLINQYNIDKKDIIAIGDNYNDIDMIKYAGLGIAMGNAPIEVKESADYITLSNDKDGLAFIINKYWE